jgi:hypothetical protein
MSFSQQEIYYSILHIFSDLQEGKNTLDDTKCMENAGNATLNLCHGHKFSATEEIFSESRISQRQVLMQVALPPCSSIWQDTQPK